MEPEHKIVYALQTSLERAIDQYKVNLSKKADLKKDNEKWEKFITNERHKIKAVAQVQQGLARRLGSS